jgi:hypothetical protein
MGGSFAPNQVNLTECLLSDIAENAAYFSYDLPPISMRPATRRSQRF